MSADLLERALALFDDGEYDEAHEVLDVLLERTTDEDSDFYKGLIQAAICLHHYALGNVDGARKLYAGHRRYLAPYLPVHRGVDVAGLLEAMQTFLRPALRATPGTLVPYDRARRPRVPREETGELR